MIERKREDKEKRKLPSPSLLFSFILSLSVLTKEERKAKVLQVLSDGRLFQSLPHISWPSWAIFPHWPVSDLHLWYRRLTRSQNAPFHLQSEALWRTYNECFLLLTLCSFFLHISSISSFVLLRSFLSTPKSLFIFSPPFFFTQILYSYMLYH